MKRIISSFLVCLLLFLSTSQVMANNISLNQDKLLAENLLESFAKKKKAERIIGGCASTVLGVGMGVLLFSIDSKALTEISIDENPLTYIILFPITLIYYGGYITSGILTGSGVLMLAIPSKVERDYKNIKKIDDSIEREEQAYSKLVSYAERAKKERFVKGVSSAALALCCIIIDAGADDGKSYYKYVGLGMAASAGKCFYVKSKEEKLLERYYEGRAYSDNQASRFKLHIGYAPNGNISAVYSYSF